MLVEKCPNIGVSEDLAERLETLAGSGLAPEWKYRERVEERHMLYRYSMPRIQLR